MLAQGYQPSGGGGGGGSSSFSNQKAGGLFTDKGPFASKNAFGGGPMTRSQTTVPMSGGGGRGHGGGWSVGYEHQKANTADGRMHGYSYGLQSKPKESGLDWIENNSPLAKMGQQMGSAPATLTGTMAPYQGPLKDDGINSGGISAGQPFRSNRDDEWFQATDGSGAPIGRGSYTATKPGVVLTPSQMQTLTSVQPGPRAQWEALTPQQQMQLMKAGDISQEQLFALDTMFPSKMGAKRDPATGAWPRSERGFVSYKTHDLFPGNDDAHMKSLFPWWGTGLMKDNGWPGYSTNMDNLRSLFDGVKGPGGQLPTIQAPTTAPESPPNSTGNVQYIDDTVLRSLAADGSIHNPVDLPPIGGTAIRYKPPVQQPTRRIMNGVGAVAIPSTPPVTINHNLDWLAPTDSAWGGSQSTAPVIKTAPTPNPPTTRPMTAYELGAPADLQQARKWARDLWVTAERTGDKGAKDLATKAVAWANLPPGQRQAILAREERILRLGDQAQTFRSFDPKLDQDALTNRTLWDDLNRYNKTGKLDASVTSSGKRKELRDSKGNLIGFSEDKGVKPKGGTVTDNGQTMSFDDWFELHNPATQKRIEAEVAKRLAA
jgi:hypothetical protein